MTIPILLAGINGINAQIALRELTPNRSTVSDTLVLFGALFMVALLFFTYAIIFRPRPHRQLTRHHYARSASNGNSNGSYRKRTSFNSYRRHRRHSEEFPLNPTLAEVGGLPPLRPKDRPPFPA